MKYRDGEYIEMEWEFDELWQAVKGWPGESAVREELERQGSNVAREWAFKECWAAFLQTHNSRSNGWSSEMMLFDSPGRGRFKVSVLMPNAQADRPAKAGERCDS